MKTSALVLSTTSLQSLDFGTRLFTSWRVLEGYVRERLPLGLRDPNPLDLTVVLEPASFGTRRYDPISQSFGWDIYDQTDELIVMSLPFREWSQDAIRVLEALEPRENSRWRVIVRTALRDGALSIEPISVLQPEVLDRPIFQLAFDALPANSGMKRKPEAAAREDDGDSEEESLAEEAASATHTHASKFISELNGQLLGIAEMGCQSADRSSRQWFEKRCRDLFGAGFTLLAGLTSSLAQAEIAPGDVLRIRYLAYLHTQAIVQAI